MAGYDKRPGLSGAVVADEVHRVVGGIGIGDVGYVVKDASDESEFFDCAVASAEPPGGVRR